MSGATSKCSGTDGAKFPMVDVGQVPVSGAAQGAVSCLDIFLFRNVSNVTWVRSTAACSSHSIRSSPAGCVMTHYASLICFCELCACGVC